MPHDFEFNNKKLSDIGAVIIDKPSYALSVKELDFTSLPGKSGDIITDKNRFKNLSISYKISSMPPFSSYTEQEFVHILSEWLLSCYDYKILRDSKCKGYFRRAVCTGISNPTVEASRVVWTTVTFNCDPFLYSDTGTHAVIYKSNNNYRIESILRNNEKWESEPIIEIIPNGAIILSLNINGTSVTIEQFDKAITIDVPDRNVYFSESGTPCNDRITANKLPILSPGNNSIFANGIGSYTVKITPNWRRL